MYERMKSNQTYNRSSVWLCVCVKKNQCTQLNESDDAHINTQNKLTLRNCFHPTEWLGHYWDYYCLMPMTLE